LLSAEEQGNYADSKGEVRKEQVTAGMKEKKRAGVLAWSLKYVTSEIKQKFTALHPLLRFFSPHSSIKFSQ
jgi:hypothetical protein